MEEVVDKLRPYLARMEGVLWVGAVPGLAGAGRMAAPPTASHPAAAPGSDPGRSTGNSRHWGRATMGQPSGGQLPPLVAQQQWSHQARADGRTSTGWECRGCPDLKLSKAARCRHANRVVWQGAPLSGRPLERLDRVRCGSSRSGCDGQGRLPSRSGTDVSRPRGIEANRCQCASGFVVIYGSSARIEGASSY